MMLLKKIHRLVKDNISETISLVKDIKEIKSKIVSLEEQIKEKDSKILSSCIEVPWEYVIFAIKKNKGNGTIAINTLFHKFLAAGHDKTIHNSINAKISKKISESS